MHITRFLNTIMIQDSKAFIRQCTDINHTNQRNNEYMSGDPR